MSISIGGLGLVSLRSHVLEIVGVVLAKGAFRSMFSALLLLALVLILAYVSNPSENSFRTYLTEQSFRQHLSRLDDNNEEDHTRTRDFHSPQHTPNNSTDNNRSPFHFADRASISLRTPKHAFHSFGIFTIAAMVPVPKSDHSYDRNVYRDGSMISDSWFIGAFGKWWRGGMIEAWYQDVVARSKDEESWSSGILAVKALDKFNECNGLPFSTKNSLPFGPPRGSPPRLRNRERPSQRLATLPSRSSTPPPLPKSACLPLHSTRPTHSIPDHRHAQPDRTSSHSQPSPPPSEPTRSGTPIPSTALLDQSPAIAEVLRQISISNSTVHDLREQLADFQSTASQSHALLQTEVDSFRDRKRQEDASKLELKSRTKTLEDSKRTAESAKVKVEKRLKAAQNACDDATQQTTLRNQQIAELQTRLADGETLAEQTKENTSKAEKEISEALERKRQEIKVAEDVLVALNARSRQLEEKLASERERLRLVQAQADIRKQDQSFGPFHSSTHYSTPWPCDPSCRSDYMVSIDPHPSLETDLGARKSNSNERSISPTPANLSLGGMSNFTAGSSDIALRAKGYSIFDDDIASLTNSHRTFSPFNENSTLAFPSSELPTLLSPSLLPVGNINSLHGTDGLSRSFQSDSDPYMEKDWRGPRVLHQAEQPRSTALSVSPISDVPPPVNDYDPFEVRFIKHDRLPSEPLLDLQRFSTLCRTNSDPNPNGYNEAIGSLNTDHKIGPRRWFSSSSKDKARKGLNPDAKVFRLPKKSTTVTAGGAGGPAAPGGESEPPYDALNPNGPMGGCATTMSSASSSFLHAFAPSPAEREALHRALGGGGGGGTSTNASLERLPSLSDVGHPSSPSHRHQQHQQPQPQPQRARQQQKGDVGKVALPLPSWLQSLPRIQKPNFSPWEDEEPSGSLNPGHG